MSEDNVFGSAQEVAELMGQGGLDSCMVQEVDLTKVGLEGLEGSDLSFKRVALHAANATGCDLARARFSECSLRGTDFSDSLMRGCSFFSCELIETNFSSVTMSGTSFYSAHLQNGRFTGSRIQSGTFNGCELFGVDFSRCLILNTRFDAPERGNVTLDRASFTHAVLVDCDLLGANLYGANFDQALLVKVDLRHANLTDASFEGAHLIDVQIDTSQLSPKVRQQVEAARVEDPWRKHGFMKSVLATYSPEEMMLLLEYVMRTYIIEGAEPSAGADTMPALVSQMKARHDFSELDALRVRGTQVQVRLGRQWYDLDSPAAPSAAAASEDDAPAPPGPPTAPAPAAAMPPPGAPAPEAEAVSEPPAQRPPKNVGTSKRFRRLEID